MPVAFILDFPGGTLEQYDRVIEDMALGGVSPPGALHHGAGATPDGLRVVDVWETDAAFQDFTDAKIGPLTQKHGIAEPQVQRIELAEIMLGSDPGARATYQQVVRLDGTDADAFNAFHAQVLVDNAPPAGCTHHVNGAVDGGWIVIDHWTSREACDTFIAERVVPVAQAAGLEMPPIEDLDVHNTITPATTTA